MRCLGLAFACCSLTISVASQAADLSAVCGQLGEKPFPYVNTGLVAGSVYLRSGSSFKPTSANLVCSGVFTSSPSQPVTAYIADEKVTKSNSGSLGISFLKNVVGSANSAKIDASLNHGVTWEIKSDPLQMTGYTLLESMEFTASDSSCFSRIKAALYHKSSVSAYVVYQVASTNKLSYTLTSSSGTSIAPNLTINNVVEANVGLKIDKTSSRTLEVSGKQLNVCYAPPTKARISKSRDIAPRQFMLVKES